MVFDDCFGYISSKSPIVTQKVCAWILFLLSSGLDSSGMEVVSSPAWDGVDWMVGV